MTLTEEIMQAAFAAPDDRKRDALRVLKGEVEPAVKPTAVVEPYLTLRETARRLGISTCSLWRYGVPGRNFGGRRRFRISEVEAYLASEDFAQRQTTSGKGGGVAGK